MHDRGTSGGGGGGCRGGGGGGINVPAVEVGGKADVDMPKPRTSASSSRVVASRVVVISGDEIF